MATANVSTICSACKNKTTTYSCPGCSNYFCVDDLLTHREELKSQFHEIEHQRNEFMQILTDQNENNRNNHPLINQINQWEQKSIEKIKKIAQEQRQLIQQSILSYVQNIQTELNTLTEDMQKINKKKDFNEMALNKLKKQLNHLEEQLNHPTHIEIKQDSSATFIQKLSINIKSNITSGKFYRHQLKANLKWKQYGKTIAGGNGKGDQLNQLNRPYGIYVDHQQKHIYIVDNENHRIVKWKIGENNGQIVAGGNGRGNRIHQLNSPVDVIVDENNKSLIISDYGNRRVVRWSLQNTNDDKEILIQNIRCYGLVMNENGDLFVSDLENCTVKRWKNGEIGKGKEGTIVAGGNGRGNQLNQLNGPSYIFIDRKETVYVSDCLNHRVMKWLKGAREGIVIAGEQDEDSLNQLNHPQGLVVNEIGDIYVADWGNSRIMSWSLGSTEGRVIVGGNGYGRGSNQLNSPFGLSFDVENNLYVADFENHRIQQFEVNKN